jgi:hypothetical protein
VSSSVTRYVLVASGFLGGFLAVSGSLFLVAPRTGLALFGLTAGDEELLPAVGVRQLAFGLVILLLALLREVRALSVVLLVGAAVPAVDGLVVWRAVGSGASMRHLAAVPVCAALGVALRRGSRA